LTKVKNDSKKNNAQLMHILITTYKELYVNLHGTVVSYNSRYV